MQQTFLASLSSKARWTGTDILPEGVITCTVVEAGVGNTRAYESLTLLTTG